MRAAIDAVDWGGVSGRPAWYEPARAARGLRALADAANPVEAAEAGSLLADGGIVHGHSAAVFPAAAVATPLLLDIAEQGHPAARDRPPAEVPPGAVLFPAECGQRVH